ncbi:hypothetical protein IFM89_023064 [Coptis chinensis]|uniref:Factor of DNA methylation 1-5/IDN2 domain-containing protein n=1 Tax=Coptis chinensis TaxID=261450 RepID=A0A835IGQ0_9MAGN|nr:hypothetical protein IFM89_023064 [Coptis chinensis]
MRDVSSKSKKRKSENSFPQNEAEITVLTGEMRHAKYHQHKQKLASMAKELEEKEALNNALIVKHRRDCEELSDARKGLIRVSINTDANVTNLITLFFPIRIGKGSGVKMSAVGIKRMGELNPKPFKVLVIKRLLTHMLQRKKRYSSVLSGKLVIKEDDEQLQQLMTSDLESNVYDAVYEALKEINEYNPSGRNMKASYTHTRPEEEAQCKGVLKASK